MKCRETPQSPISVYGKKYHENEKWRSGDDEASLNKLRGFGDGGVEKLSLDDSVSATCRAW